MTSLSKTQSATRQYTQREVNTGDMPVGQKADIDLDSPIIHGEALGNISGDTELSKGYLADLAFMEEPVTILIQDNSGNSQCPETHVPVAVNGKDAEVLQNGRWMAIGWLPIGVELTTKRKYVEVLARSKSDAVNTNHDDATVERPRNMINRRTSQNYPLSVLHDGNPRGREWLSRIMMGH
jgi:hypothetical protein